MIGHAIARTGLVGLVAAALASGCAAQLPNAVVAGRDLPEAAGAPSIERIVDLGGRDVPLDGVIDGRGADGVIAVGETLWIRGHNLGRQPTVLVAGRPAAVLSRTADGGILVRVPAGVPVGKQSLVVSQSYGRAEQPIVVRRYAVVLRDQVGAGDGMLGFVEITPDGPVLAGHADAGINVFLAMSGDGRAAYVTGPMGGLVAVYGVDGVDNPKPAFQIEIGLKPVRALLSGGSDLVVLRGDDILLFDTSSALRPARRNPRGLPAALVKETVVASAISTDGRYIALALEAANRIVMLDIDKCKRGGDPVVADLAVDRDAHAPVLTDVRFSPGGETLWVLAGETTAALALGPQITRVHALRVAHDGGGIKLENARTVEIPGACRPGRIATTRNLPLANGAAIRLPPEKVTVFITGCVREDQRFAMFSLGAEDKAVEVASAPSMMNALDVEPEGHFVLGAFAAANGGLRVLSARADGRAGESHSIAAFGPTVEASSAPSGPDVDPPIHLLVQP